MQYYFFHIFQSKFCHILWYCSILLTKERMFNILIDSSNIFIFSASLPLLLEMTERIIILFVKIWYFRIFKFCIFTTSKTIGFFHFNLFRTYWKYFSIVLLFLSQSLGEYKLIYSGRYYTFTLGSKNIPCNTFVIYKLFNLFWNMLNSEAIKYVTSSPFTYKAIQWLPINSCSSKFITYAPSSILDKLFLEQTALNIGSFW